MHPCNSDVATRHQSFKLCSPPTVSTPKRSPIWHGAWLPGSNTDVFDRN